MSSNNHNNSNSIKHFIKYHKKLNYKSINNNNSNTNDLKNKLKNIDSTTNFKYTPIFKSNNNNIKKHFNNFYNYLKNIKLKFNSKLKSYNIYNTNLSIEELYYLYKKNAIYHGFNEYLIEKEYDKLLQIYNISYNNNNININRKLHNSNLKNTHKYIINQLQHFIKHSNPQFLKFVKNEYNINMKNSDINKFVNYNFDYILSLFLIEYKQIFVKEIFYNFHYNVIMSNYIFYNKTNKLSKEHVFKDFIYTFSDVFFDIFSPKYDNFFINKYNTNTNINNNIYLDMMRNYINHTINFHNEDKENISFFLMRFIKYAFYLIFSFIYSNKKSIFNNIYHQNNYINSTNTIDDDILYMFTLFINYPTKQSF